MLFSVYLFVYLLGNAVQGDIQYRKDYMLYDLVGKFYKVHDEATHWFRAKQICEAEGTALMVPNSVNEMEYVKVMMSNLKFQYSAIFVGIHDLYADGNYITIMGDLVTGTLRELMWAEGSPDSFRNTEHCVAMTRVALLDDRACTDAYPFICEIAQDEVKYNKECEMYDSGYKLQSDVDNKCYKFHHEPLSWYDAYMTCTREEGELAIINTPEEAAIITGILRDHNIKNNVPDPNILYLGFSDLLFPYQYRTIKDDTLKTAGFSSFNPAKERLEANKTKRCGAISRAGYLVVTECEQPAMYLCQKLLNNSDEYIYYGVDYEDDIKT